MLRKMKKGFEGKKVAGKEKTHSHILISHGKRDYFQFSSNEEFWSYFDLFSKEYVAVSEKIPPHIPLTLIFKGQLSSNMEETIKDIRKVIMSIGLTKDIVATSCVHMILLGKDDMKFSVLKFNELMSTPDEQVNSLIPIFEKKLRLEFEKNLLLKDYWTFQFKANENSLEFYHDESYQPITNVQMGKLSVRSDDIMEQEFIEEEQMDKIINDKQDVVDYSYHELLKMIKEDRMSFETNWEDLGGALYNITFGSEEGLHDWIAFSKVMRKKYEEKKLEITFDEYSSDKWYSFDPTTNFYTIKTLEFWAEKDAPEEYKLHQYMISRKNLEKCLRPSSGFTDYAEFVISYIKLKYIGVGSKKVEWFTFSGHSFKRIKSDHVLRHYISHEICSFVETYYIEISKKANNGTKDDEHAKMLVRCEKFIKDLKDPGKKSKILSEVIESPTIRDDEIISKIDHHHERVCFFDGVYNLKNREFVEGKPEDFCFRTTRRSYRRSCEKSRKYYEDFISKVLVDKEHREAFHMIIALSWRYGNIDKRIVGLLGEKGNNGKTSILRLLSYVFGDYSVDTGAGFLESKMPKLGSPCPEIIQLEGVRLGLCGEASEDGFLDGVLSKTVSSSGDGFRTRELQSNEMREILLGLTPLVPSNHKFNIKSVTDRSLVNRIIYILFDSRFIEEGFPDNEQDQLKKKTFPMIKDIKNHLRLMVDGLTELLFEKYEEIQQADFKMKYPQSVLAVNKKIKENSNIVIRYLQKKIDKHEGSEIRFSDIYLDFRAECQESGIAKMLIPKDIQFKTCMCTHLNLDPDLDKWEGFRHRL